MTDLNAVFSRAVASAGDRTALIAPDGTIGFAELDRRATAFAAVCAARGLRKGDRVIVAMPLGIDLFVALSAAWRIGATVVFPEPAMGLSGFLHALRQTRPKGLLAAGRYRWLKLLLPQLWFRRMVTPSPRDTGMHQAARLASTDPALISFTSGSTGAPKGIVRSHGFLMAQYEAVSPVLGSSTQDVDLVAFPVFVLVNMAAGRTSVLPDWPLTDPGGVSPPALSSWIERSGATRSLLPPATCERLAEARLPDRFHTVFTGGGPVFPDLVDRLHRSAGIRVVSVYGSTEAEPIAELDWSTVAAEDLRRMAEGAGLLAGAPVPQVRLRIVDDEILVAGPHVNEGYLDPSRDSDTKIRDGGTIWHRTGDAGRLDGTGRLWLLGRRDAVIEQPSGRLFPFGVEVAARGWPGVRRAALWRKAGASLLVIEGDPGRVASYRERAEALGVAGVQLIERMPMDRRHGSKIDYTALDRALDGSDRAAG